MDGETLRKRVAERLTATGKQAIPVARQIGRGRDYLSDLIKGKKDSLAAETLAPLARELDCPIEYLMDADFTLVETKAKRPKSMTLAQLKEVIKKAGTSSNVIALTSRPRKIGRDVPVMGAVAAGRWFEAASREGVEAEEYLPLDVPGYERAQLYALKVVGTSMDKVYPPGRFVVVAPAAEAGVREGDYVIVERRQGDLVELTIKELVTENGRVALWPRSNDPVYQEPFYVRGEGGDQDAPRVIGVVVADFGKRNRPDLGAFRPPVNAR